MLFYLYDKANIAEAVELDAPPIVGELIHLPSGDTYRVESVDGQTSMFHAGETVEATKVLIGRFDPIAELARELCI